MNLKTRPIIVPVDVPGESKVANLENVTYEQICKVLGFAPNVEDDPDKVKYSWGFTIDGEPAGIWDYYGSSSINRWSVSNTKVLDLFR
jgi:hypothetical protein